MRRFVVLALVATLAGPARAEPEPGEKIWYGWKILAIDAGSLALIATGIAVDVDAVTTVGVISGLVVSPMVHSAHGNQGRAAASLFAFRPLAALGTGLLVATSCPDEAPCSRRKVIGVVGMVTAGVSLLDAAFGYETVRITPIVTPTTAGLGVAGTF